jgi:hypothetical protein
MAAAAAAACCRPARGDWVGLVGETFGDSAVRAMRQRMRDSPTGQQILADRPRVTVSSSATMCDSDYSASLCVSEIVCTALSEGGVVALWSSLRALPRRSAAFTAHPGRHPSVRRCGFLSACDTKENTGRTQHPRTQCACCSLWCRRMLLLRIAGTCRPTPLEGPMRSSWV